VLVIAVFIEFLYLVVLYVKKIQQNSKKTIQMTFLLQRSVTLVMGAS